MNCLKACRHAAVLAVFFGVIVHSFSVQASTCQPFPTLALWGDYTHAKVIKMVSERLEGDWSAYLSLLENRQRMIKDLQSNGKSLTLKSKGKRYVLSGRKLAAYIRVADRRNDIVRCLADEADQAQLSNFETAAGSVKPAGGETADVEVAAVRQGRLDMEIKSQCVYGDTTFTITNQGEAWPQRSAIDIYRLDRGRSQKIHSRRLRFAAGQSVKLKVPAAKNPTGQLGLFIDAPWAQRPFKMDRTLTCN